MDILCIGDVVSSQGADYVRQAIRDLKKEYKFSLIIANGENSAQGNGMTPFSCEHLLDSGVNVITGGNHSFRRREILEYLEENKNVLRPLNYPNCTIGNGYYLYDMGKYSICVINLIGRTFMNSVDCPFKTVDLILKEINTKFIIVDFHAEATSEKLALAHYLNGRVSCVFGTHTHVQTSDESILSQQTGYITDLGMSGPIDSILGLDKTIVINSFLTAMPRRWEVLDTKCKMEGIIVSLNEKTGLCDKINRIRV